MNYSILCILSVIETTPVGEYIKRQGDPDCAENVNDYRPKCFDMLDQVNTGRTQWVGQKVVDLFVIANTFKMFFYFFT